MERPCVLLVDDDAMSRAIVAAKLKALASILEAEDGEDAIGRLHSENVDLVIVDLEMPKINGLELIRYIRGAPTLRHIPIIVLTANDQPGALESSFMAGITSALFKPLNWRAFGEHVRHLLEIAHRSSHMALHDHLTGLPNRVLLNERLQIALPNASREAPVAVHIVDLDRFKHVNDTLGHAAGDALLRQVANRLRALSSRASLVARLGGDEFALLQCKIATLDEARTLAQEVIARLSEPYDLDGHPASIGASVGIDIVQARAEDVDQVMRNADAALYRAKRAGRGNYAIFERTCDETQAARAALCSELRIAVEREEFVLGFSPIARTADGWPVAFEAHMRWSHPRLGMLDEPAFLPVADEAGLAGVLAQIMLRQACRAAQQWPLDCRVCVKVVPSQFEGETLAAAVHEALLMAKLHPARLELAIREDEWLNCSTRRKRQLQSLSDVGVGLVMDAFGTGATSLRDIQDLPVVGLRVQGPFVGNSGAATILRTAVALGRGLGISIVAAGLDTADEFALAEREGSLLTQGACLGPVLTEEEAGSASAGAGPYRGQHAA